MRRTFPTTAGCTPLASSSAMNRRNPFWLTFRVLTGSAEHDGVRCQATLYGRGLAGVIAVDPRVGEQRLTKLRRKAGSACPRSAGL